MRRALPLLASLCLPTIADAQHTRIALDDALRKVSGQVVELSSETLRLRTPDGRTQSIPRSRLLAIYAPRGHTPEAPATIASPTAMSDGSDLRPGILTLTDSQIVPGFLWAAPNDDTLRWRSRRVGMFSVPLDRVRSVQFGPSHTEAPMSASEDTLLLANKDRLEGLVLGIGESVSFEANSTTSTFPIDRVHSIELKNPATPIPPAIAYFADGSVLGVRSVIAAPAGTDAQTLRPTTAGTGRQDHPLWTLNFDLGDDAEAPATALDDGAIDAIVLRARSLVPLASLRPESVKAEEVSLGQLRPAPVVARDGPVGLREIELPGPMTVTWTLPAGASRFATTLALPAPAVDWGNASVSIILLAADGREIESLRHDLTSRTSSVNVNLELRGARRLVITLSAGPYGRVQSRANLVEPVIVLESAR